MSLKQMLIFSLDRNEKQATLFRVIAQIRDSVDIDTIFKSAVKEVRQLLKTDRVSIFHFSCESHWTGKFICEDVGVEYTSILGIKLGDQSFAQEFARSYEQRKIIAINDTYSEAINPCYTELQRRFQVHGSITVPLMKSHNLWGLLCIHQCIGARIWELEEIEFVQLIAEHLGLALQQADYIEQVKLQSAQLAQAKAQKNSVEWQKTITKTIEKIRQHIDLEGIFRASTVEIKQVLAADRVAIYRFNPDWSGEFVFESVSEGWVTLMQEQLKRPELGENISECKLKDLLNPPPDTYLKDTEGGRFSRGETYRICRDIYQAGFHECYLEVLETYQARAYVIIAILHSQRVWGLLAVYQNTGPRDWQEHELYLLVQVAAQLGVALQQAELLAQTKYQKEAIAKTLQELQQTQSQLIQSEKMAGLGQLVAGVAHEINNPISFIYGNIHYVTEHMEDLLKLVRLYAVKYPHPDAEIQQCVESIDFDFVTDDLPKLLNSMMIGANRIRELVLSLRTFSRLDESEKKPVNIHQGIDSTLLILNNRLQSLNGDLSIEVIREYDDLPPVICYPAQLNQVFMNMIINAIDAIETAIGNNTISSHPKIWIRTKLIAENSLQICIADNGCGIPENMRSRIFEPFFTTKEPGKGKGLGLSISYQIIVEKHHGQIRCTSEPNRGCEFWIEIPLNP
jgi:signal transduction histidine kinase